MFKPFMGPTLFGGALTSLQKVDMEWSKNLTVFPRTATPLTSYTTQPYAVTVVLISHAPLYGGGLGEVGGEDLEARIKKSLFVRIQQTLGIDSSTF